MYTQGQVDGFFFSLSQWCLGPNGSMHNTCGRLVDTANPYMRINESSLAPDLIYILNKSYDLVDSFTGLACSIGFVP